MCSPAVIEFARSVLTESEVEGKRVIEVGALDVNGSVRPIIESYRPAVYVGIDIQMGPGVDVICDASGILAHFGAESFDILISTEVLEHVRDWREAVHNFKHAVKPAGILLVTTRSFGVDFHRHPFDFWRYERPDFGMIFSDFIIEELQADPQDPGIFLKAKKPAPFIERDLSGYRLYSILRRKRIVGVTAVDLVRFQLRYRLIRLLLDLLPKRARRPIRERLLR